MPDIIGKVNLTLKDKISFNGNKKHITEEKYRKNLRGAGHGAKKKGFQPIR